MWKLASTQQYLARVEKHECGLRSGQSTNRSLTVLDLWAQLSPDLTAKGSSVLSLRGDTTLKSCAAWVQSSALLQTLCVSFSLK